MKRSVGGGAHRGPVGAGRQRRTIRLMQGILVVIAAALLMYSGYALGRASGFERARRTSELGGVPRKPAAAQTVVLALLGLASLGGAVAVQGFGGGVIVPTPARLDEFTNRAQAAAIARAEETEEARRP